jgi:hypothetical protein
MPYPAKPRWIIRTLAAPLLLSLALHGLLFLALWLWPARTRSPTLTIASTRITLDACALDSRSATLLPAAEFPPDLLGPDVNTTLAPRLEAPPTLHKTPDPVPHPDPVPDGRTGNGIGMGSGIGNNPHDGGNLFPLPATATSVVYVLDRSVSMGIDRKLDFARRKLIDSLRRLPPSVRFQVIDYNDSAKSLIVDGQRDLLPAEPAIIDKAVFLLEALDAAGTTNHLAALRRGLDLHPDVLFFLTDADDLKPEVISAITQRNQHSVIHTIELTRFRTPRPEGPLAQLAHNNHGTYRRVAVGD